MESKKIEELFKRYLQNQCLPEEIKLLFDYFDADENESELKNLIRSEFKSSEDIDVDERLQMKGKIDWDNFFRKLKKD